jgi:hypothetical protein
MTSVRRDQHRALGAIGGIEGSLPIKLTICYQRKLPLDSHDRDVESDSEEVALTRLKLLGYPPYG